MSAHGVGAAGSSTLPTRRRVAVWWRLTRRISLAAILAGLVPLGVGCGDSGNAPADPGAAVDADAGGDTGNDALAESEAPDSDVDTGLDEQAVLPDPCPFTASDFCCPYVCDSIKLIAASCLDAPEIPQDLADILRNATSGTPDCPTVCSTESVKHLSTWKCLQGVPSSSDCAAIAGCSPTYCG